MTRKYYCLANRYLEWPKEPKSEDISGNGND